MGIRSAIRSPRHFTALPTPGWVWTSTYSAIDVTVPDLPAFMETVRGEPGWRGLSVTMPLKTAMVSEVDEVRGVAGILGVVNTVVFEADGPSVRRIGYNTDVAGIVNAVRHAGVVAAPSAVILGGGGTAAAAIAALKDLGAPSADVFVRDVGRAAEARAASDGVGLPIRVLPLSGAAAAMAAADVVISTLPPRGADALADELAGLRRRDATECCWTSPTIPGPAGSPPSGRTGEAPWCPAWRCCCTRRWSRSGFSAASATTSRPKS